MPTTDVIPNHVLLDVLWYNDRRRHKEIGRITPNQKWLQGQRWSSDKQRDTGSVSVLSRPGDALKNQNKNYLVVGSGSVKFREFVFVWLFFITGDTCCRLTNSPFYTLLFWRIRFD